MSGKTVRWGILGAGFIAEKFAADAKAAVGAEVVAVAARDGDKALAFAHRHGIRTAHEGYGSLVADTEVDVVYVATPHGLHKDHALLAIQAGKSVLVEKPFALNAHEAEAVFAEARYRGVFAMEGLWTLCNPLVIELKERIASGSIGTPLSFSANVGPLGVPTPRSADSRFTSHRLGASFMLECHVYPLALAAHLVPALAEPENVIATATFSANGIDDSAAILFTGAGAIGTVAGGFCYGAQATAPSRLQIIGTDGWIEIVDDLFNPGLAIVCTPDNLDELDYRDQASRGLASEIEEASRCIALGLPESEIVSTLLTTQVLRTLDAARASAGITVGDAQ